MSANSSSMIRDTKVHFRRLKVLIYIRHDIIITIMLPSNPKQIIQACNTVYKISQQLCSFSLKFEYYHISWCHHVAWQPPNNGIYVIEENLIIAVRPKKDMTWLKIIWSKKKTHQPYLLFSKWDTVCQFANSTNTTVTWVCKSIITFPN